jgi:16S rRNA (guanine527-N7)-methyltransferase
VDAKGPPESFRAALAAEGLALEVAQLDLLDRYLRLLEDANRSLNLTAVRGGAEAWHRHVLESLALAAHLGDADSVVDLGSGAGLPGLPLAAVLPSKTFALVEATGKKARFLESAAADLGLGNVTVLPRRAEELGRDAAHRERHDAVVVRAVGTLAELVELSLPLLRVGGRLLAVKGARAEQEVSAARTALAELGGRPAESRPLLPAGGGESVVVEVLKERPTPDRFPRRTGMPHKRPLGGRA